jgi:hypothetical protein
MKTPFCFISIHNWEYRRELHKVVDHPSGRNTIRVVVRECKWCGHREHHLLPRENGRFVNWENWDSVSKEATLNYKKLYTDNNDKFK